MNKLLTKIVGVVIGTSMAVGVGTAVVAKNSQGINSEVRAETAITGYTAVSSASEITDNLNRQYLICAIKNSTVYLMGHTGQKPAGTSTTSGDLSSYLFTIEYNSTYSGYTFKSSADTYCVYASSTNLTNPWPSSVSSNNGAWTIGSGVNGTIRVTNIGSSNRCIAFNGSAFGPYATSNVTSGSSSYFDLEFYYASGSVDPDKLGTPHPVFDRANNNITWADVTNAESYEVTLDEGQPVTSNSPYSVGSVSLNTAHSVSVVAKATDYTTSDAGSVTFHRYATKGTSTDPYTVADARRAIGDDEGKTGAYATGIVSQINTAYDSQHSNITFSFSEDGSTSSNQLKAYRCGSGAADASSVAVGDTVVVHGDLTLYQSSDYQFSQGCTLEVLNHPVVPTIIFSNEYGNILIGETKTTYIATTSNLGGATLTYTSSSEAKATIDSSTGAVTGVALGDTTIKASAIVDDEEIQDTYVLHVVEPMTISSAKTFIDAGVNLADNYVGGIISEVSSFDNGAITYYISDDGSTTNQMEVYKGKDLAGASFEEKADLQVGDVVVVWGTLKKYNSTYEFDNGNHLVRFSRPNKYTVTFNSNGGSLNPEDLSVIENNTFEFPSAGTKAGYVFAGWSSNGGTTKYAAGATSPSVVGPITYVAYWDVDPVETVTLTQGTFKTTYTSNDTSWDWENLIVSYETESGVSGSATGLTSSDFTFDPTTPSDVDSVDVYVTYGGVKSNTLSIDVTYTLGGSMSTFEDISGDLIEDIIHFAASKGGASTAPAVNGGEIRVYQDGGLFEVTAYSGYKLTSVTIGSSMGTTVTYSIDGGAESANQSITANETTSVDGISASSVLFKCTGTTKNTRLYVNYLAATYSVDTTPTLEVECGTSLTLSTASGAMQYGITHNYIADDANVTVTLGKNGVVTAFVSNWVLTITPVATEEDSTTVTISASTASYVINVSIVEAVEYTKVTDIDYLYKGQQVIIGSTDGSNVLGPQQTNNRSAVETAHAGSSVFLPEDSTATVLTVDLQEESNGTIHYSFYDSTAGKTGYLHAGYNEKENYLTVTANKSDEGALFTITISNTGVATIVSNGTSERNTIRYNSTSSLFAGYSGGQKDVSIYACYDDVADSNVVSSFVTRYMKMASISTSETGSTASCESNWEAASTAYAKLSASQKALFVTDSAFADAAARLAKWAEANGHTLASGTGVLTANGKVALFAFNSDTAVTTTVIVISILTITTLGGYFLLRKRKEER